jgi:hypothetical protein
MRAAACVVEQLLVSPEQAPSTALARSAMAVAAPHPLLCMLFTPPQASLC